VAKPASRLTVSRMRTSLRPVVWLWITRLPYLVAALAVAVIAARNTMAFWPDAPLFSNDQDHHVDVIEAFRFAYEQPTLGGVWSWSVENRYLGPAYNALAAAGGALFAALFGTAWFALGAWAGPVLFSQLLLAYAAFRLGRGFNPLVGWSYYGVVVYLVTASNPPLMFFQIASYAVISPAIFAMGAFLALYSARRTDRVAVVLTAGVLLQAHPAGAALGVTTATIVAFDLLREILNARRAQLAIRFPYALVVAYIFAFGPVVARFVIEGTQMIDFVKLPITWADRLRDGFLYLNSAVFRFDGPEQPRLLGAVVVVTIFAAGAALLLSRPMRRFGVTLMALQAGLVTQAFALTSPYPSSVHTFNNWYAPLVAAVRGSVVWITVLTTVAFAVTFIARRLDRSPALLLRFAAIPVAVAVVVSAAPGFAALPLDEARPSPITDPVHSARFLEMAEKLPSVPFALLTGENSATFFEAAPVYAAALAVGKDACVHESALPVSSRRGLGYLMCTAADLDAVGSYVLVPSSNVTVDLERWRLLYDGYVGTKGTLPVYLAAQPDDPRHRDGK
jgi:hypothetical protein